MKSKQKALSDVSANEMLMEELKMREEVLEAYFRLANNTRFLRQVKFILLNIIILIALSSVLYSFNAEITIIATLIIFIILIAFLILIINPDWLNGGASSSLAKRMIKEIKNETILLWKTQEGWIPILEILETVKRVKGVARLVAKIVEMERICKCGHTGIAGHHWDNQTGEHRWVKVDGSFCGKCQCDRFVLYGAKTEKNSAAD